MSLSIRKIVTHIEETRIEGGKVAEPPQKMIAVAAVIANPWAGKGFVEDLRTDILALAPPLGDVMVPMVLDAAGGPDAIEAFGKAAVVGTMGEIEHASGFIHTLRFGNKFRDAVGGTSYLSFTNIRGGAGCSIQVPLMHKLDPGFRSHYLTLAFSIVDAPAPDELVIVLGAATTGRPHHRIGNRYSDMEEMKAEQGA
ncbi:MAG: amino acid synthesis family protein [Proteobacteria bacterium]|nr:amino acid synthesis family protein [Pseudomonadota bacterium]MDA1071641.1 amino acid synthesis family protein [Pseudomonadota bacterium]